MSETAIQTTEGKAPITLGDRGVSLDSFEALWRFSTAVQKSGLAPSSLKSAEAIMVAIQMGLEVGLTPMAALQNIAVVNGRPTLWGDAMLGICRGTGQMDEFDEWFEQGGERLPRNPVEFSDDVIAVCRVKRVGFSAQEVGFSVADAKKAKLWGKAGPWTDYPSRMLKYRARAFVLRDTFGDALRGLHAAEEVEEQSVAKVSSPKSFLEDKSPAPAEEKEGGDSEPPVQEAEVQVEEGNPQAETPAGESEETPDFLNA